MMTARMSFSQRLRLTNPDAGNDHPAPKKDNSKFLVAFRDSALRMVILMSYIKFNSRAKGPEPHFTALRPRFHNPNPINYFDVPKDSSSRTFVANRKITLNIALPLKGPKNNAH